MNQQILMAFAFVLTLAFLGILALVVVILVAWIVHNTLGTFCLWRATRFCRRRGLDVQRGSWRPGTDDAGRPMEWTEVQLNCLDDRKQHRIVVMAVMPLGRMNLLLDEIYPESYERRAHYASDSLGPLFNPPLVDILALKEGEKGSPLTELEVLEIRDKGACLMILPSRAAELAEVRGFKDLDPDNVWAEWQAIQNNSDSNDARVERVTTILSYQALLKQAGKV